MKTLNVDLDKLSRKGLKAYITLLEEWDDYKMKEGDDEGTDLPFPDGYDLPDAPEYSEYPEQLPRPKMLEQPEQPPRPKQVEIPEKPKNYDEDTSFTV